MFGREECYSCHSFADLEECEIHSGKVKMCPACAKRHAENVAMKTKLLD